MSDRSGSRRIRRRALARLVAEQPPLDTLHDRDTHTATNSLVPTESAFHNQRHHMRDAGDIAHDYAKSDKQIADCHERHDSLTHLSNALHAAEDDKDGENSEGYPHPSDVDVERFLPCGADGV